MTCQSCRKTIDPGNTYPSTTGSWRCADCIGDTGYATTTGYADALAMELLTGFLRGLADHLQQNTIPGAPRYTATVTVQIHSTDPVAPAGINPSRRAHRRPAPRHHQPGRRLRDRPRHPRRIPAPQRAHAGLLPGHTGPRSGH